MQNHAVMAEYRHHQRALHAICNGTRKCHEHLGLCPASTGCLRLLRRWHGNKIPLPDPTRMKTQMLPGPQVP